MKKNWKISLSPQRRLSRVECDGQPVENVRSITIAQSVGGVPTVTVEFVALGEVEVEVETDEEQAP